MKRVVDLILAIMVAVVLFVPILVVALMVKMTSKGPVLYWSVRIGMNNAHFDMPKFRSMKVDAPVVATHLLNDPKSLLTPVGDFIRKSILTHHPRWKEEGA